MHYDIYRRMGAQVKAILHAHPVYCTALAAQRREIPAFHYMVGVAGGKKIPCAPYFTFGTQALSDGIISTLLSEPRQCIGGQYSGCLMANHGIITIGKDLSGCFKVASEMELLAHQYDAPRQWILSLSGCS